MKMLMIAMAAMYLIAMLAIWALELTVGPVSLTLATARALVWPVYVTTGHPQGVRARPD